MCLLAPLMRSSPSGCLCFYSTILVLSWECLMREFFDIVIYSYNWSYCILRYFLSIIFDFVEGGSVDQFVDLVGRHCLLYIFFVNPSPSIVHFVVLTPVVLPFWVFQIKLMLLILSTLLESPHLKYYYLLQLRISTYEKFYS